MCTDNQLGKINPRMVSMVAVGATVNAWRIRIVYFRAIQKKIHGGESSIGVTHHSTQVIQIKTSLFIKTIVLDLHARCQKVESLPEIGMDTVLLVTHPQRK